VESKLKHLQGKECCETGELHVEVPHLGELAERVDYTAVGDGYGFSLHMEIPSVQKQSCIPGHGLLHLHGQRSCRDIEAQHGLDPSTSFKEYTHLAPFYSSQTFHSF